MSLCYDFQKWTMITLATIAISLIVGLVTLAYGQTETHNNKKNPFNASLKLSSKSSYEVCSLSRLGTKHLFFKLSTFAMSPTASGIIGTQYQRMSSSCMMTSITKVFLGHISS